jgi:hypothetical protein
MSYLRERRPERRPRDLFLRPERRLRDPARFLPLDPALFGNSDARIIHRLPGVFLNIIHGPLGFTAHSY